MQERSFSVENARGDAVHGEVRFTDGGGDRPAVVFCHGFKGFKDWGPFPEWGRTLAEAGLVAVHFNFSYNGVSPDAPTEFTELDRFAKNTYTRELDDVEAVLDAVAGGGLAGAPIDPSRIGLMGHSRGGGIAILHAARDDRVRALATWSSVSTFLGRFTDDQIEDWQTQGYTEVLNSRTGQVMRLDRVLYDDAREHAETLDVRAAAAQIDRPWLLVHARDDDAVDFEAAEALADANPDAELVEARGGHTFGGAHPHDGDVPASLKQVWTRTCSFFTEALASDS
jgi:dienelactone hydrolase